jgi:uncharacterized protein YggE
MPIDGEEGGREVAPVPPNPPVPPSRSRGRFRGPSMAVVVTLVAALALGGAALGVASQTSSAVDRPPAHCGPTAAKLTVQGTGQATGTPDLLTVVVQVAASGPSAADAMANDNTLAGAVVTAFTGGGVTAKDIQTSGLSLQPNYSYPKGVPTVTGYQVTNSITATLHDIAKSGALLDAVVAAGGNAVQIESIAFSASDPSQVAATARARATTQAVTRARALAHAAGQSLGPVCALTDQPEASADGLSAGSAAFSDAAAAPDVPIETGSQTQSANVTLVYALGQATR